MSNAPSALDRRHVLTGLAGLGAVLTAGSACADPGGGAAKDPHAGHGDAPPQGQPSAAHQAVIDATAGCAKAGRVCLARCTEHLAAGMAAMAACQRAVMNMLAVVGAMADVAAYRNTSAANLKALAAACAAFCRTCADACKEHAGHHEECKACMEACLACAKACDGLG